MFHCSKTQKRLRTVGREDVVTFTLPKRLKKTHYSDICLTFNPDMIEIKSAVVTEDVGIFYTVATLSVTLITRDIGSTKIGITIPHRAAAKRLKTFSTHISHRPQLA